MSGAEAVVYRNAQPTQYVAADASVSEERAKNNDRGCGPKYGRMGVTEPRYFEPTQMWHILLRNRMTMCCTQFGIAHRADCGILTMMSMCIRIAFRNICLPTRMEQWALLLDASPRCACDGIAVMWVTQWMHLDGCARVVGARVAMDVQAVKGANMSFRRDVDGDWI